MVSWAWCTTSMRLSEARSHCEVMGRTSANHRTQRVECVRFFDARNGSSKIAYTTGLSFLLWQLSVASGKEARVNAAVMSEGALRQAAEISEGALRQAAERYGRVARSWAQHQSLRFSDADFMR